MAAAAFFAKASKAKDRGHRELKILSEVGKDEVRTGAEVERRKIGFGVGDED